MCARKRPSVDVKALVHVVDSVDPDICLPEVGYVRVLNTTVLVDSRCLRGGYVVRGLRVACVQERVGLKGAR